MAQGNHPDFVEIVKAEDKTAILIEQVRELGRSLQYAPYEGRFKVCVFDDAEQMTTEAANALLKTLEEPGPQRVFVLVTPSPHLLPPTVVSRCQTLRFGLLPDELVRAWAAGRLALEDADLDLVAALAEGSVGQAAAMDVAFLRGPRLALLQELSAAAANDATAALALAEHLLEIDPNLRLGLDLLAGFVRDAVVWRLTGDARRLRNRDAVEAVAAYAGRMTIDALSRKIRALAQARRLNERNVAKPAIAAGLCLDLVAPGPTAFAKGRLPR
jgi:DNA polymerase-3 subunit delta'